MSEAEEYKKLVTDFFEVLNDLKQVFELRVKMSLNIYGDSVIEIDKWKGCRKLSTIVRVKEDTSELAYYRATQLLRNYREEHKVVEPPSNLSSIVFEKMKVEVEKDAAGNRNM